MTDLFSPLTLGPLTLPNRLVMALMTRRRAAGRGNSTGKEKSLQAYEKKHNFKPWSSLCVIAITIRSERRASPRRAMRQLLLVVAFSLAGCSLPPFVQTAVSAPAPIQPNALHRTSDDGVNQTVHLQTEKITLPLVVVKGFPFLEGEVNGVKGRLLFDIGDASSFELNSHRIIPPNGKVTGHGSFGSGQTFSVYRFPVVDDLKLAGGLDFKAIPDVSGVPGNPLEDNITPDFIGWIGVPFFKGYILKLDYQHPSVSFYKNDANGSGMRAALQGEKVLQVIHFDNAGHLNLAMLPVQIGPVPFEADLDTGSHNVLWLTPQLIRQMKKDGTLSQQSEGSFTLAKVSIDNRLINLRSRVEVTEGKAPMAAKTGYADDNIMALGYEFLSLYKTVWDYRNKTVALLQK